VIEFVVFNNLQCRYSDNSELCIDDISMQKINTVCDAAVGSRFIATLGNTIDGSADQNKSLQLLSNILSKLNVSTAVHSIMGKCDTVIPKREFTKCSGYAMRYHAFDVSDYRCIFLDTCINNESDPYDTNSDCDIFIDKEQFEWLSRLMGRSHRPAVIFLSSPVICDSENDSDKLKNSIAFRALVEKSNKVALVVSGGKTSSHTVYNGVPYINLSPMDSSDTATFAKISVSSKEIKVCGFGAQESYSIHKFHEKEEKLSFFNRLKAHFSQNKKK